MSSIRKTIRDNVATLIGSMRYADGYNLDWSPCNVIETPQRYVFLDESTQRYVYVPHAIVTLGDEECVDDDNATWAGGYTNEVTMEIRVDAPQVLETLNPNFSIDDPIDYAIDDLKRLFGLNPSANSAGCLPIMYKAARKAEMYQTGDIFLPKYIITEWLVRYVQDRASPSQVSQ